MGHSRMYQFAISMWLDLTQELWSSKVAAAGYSDEEKK